MAPGLMMADLARRRIPGREQHGMSHLCGPVLFARLGGGGDTFRSRSSRIPAVASVSMGPLGFFDTNCAGLAPLADSDLTRY